MSLDFIDVGNASFTPGYLGVFIPVADLLGVDAAELDGSEAAKEKAIASFLHSVTNYFEQPAATALGFTSSQGNVQGGGVDVFRKQYSFAFDWVANLNNTFAPNPLGSTQVALLPVPKSGANQDVGKVEPATIFPGIATVSETAATPGAGLSLSFASAPNGSSSEDIRGLTLALIHQLSADSTNTRSADKAGSITAMSFSQAVGQTPNSQYFADPDGSTDLIGEDPNGFRFFRLNYSATFEFKANFAEQKFDLNSVKA